MGLPETISTEKSSTGTVEYQFLTTIPNWGDAVSRKPEYMLLVDKKPLATALPLTVFPWPHLKPCSQASYRLSSASIQDTQQPAQGSSSDFTISNSLLLYQGWIYVPPRSLWSDLQQLTHSSQPAGHFGQPLRTCEFRWPWVHSDVTSHISFCDVCRWIQTLLGKPSRLLQPLPPPTRP